MDVEGFLDSNCDGDPIPIEDRPQMKAALRSKAAKIRASIQERMDTVYSGVVDKAEALLESVSSWSSSARRILPKLFRNIFSTERTSPCFRTRKARMSFLL